MSTRALVEDAGLRDGFETMPEMADLQAELLPRKPLKTEQDADLDEALLETFPASDLIASGKIA
jgi:hypothetical protein